MIGRINSKMLALVLLGGKAIFFFKSPVKTGVIAKTAKKANFGDFFIIK